MHKVIVTRPKERSQLINNLLEEYDIDYVNIPCLDISGLYIDKSNLPKVEDYNNFIFTSISAVDYFFVNYKNQNNIKKILNLENNNVFAIGKSTAQKLGDYGIENILYPKSRELETSEDFINLLSVNINNNYTNNFLLNFLLIRGETSREYISKYLASISMAQSQDYEPLCKSYDELIVYKTSCPDDIINNMDFKNIFINNQNFNNIIILITSNSILENFYKTLCNVNKIQKSVLNNSHIITASNRILDKAIQLGFKKVYTTNSMDNIEFIKNIQKINNS